jgi:calcineurin-like phosphoesterase family protein
MTSDLHLGHRYAATSRGYSTVDEHDTVIIRNLAALDKRDKLFILGDVAWNQTSLALLSEVRATKEMIFGNHDTMSIQKYLAVFDKVHGARMYKDYFLTHIPIHPQELYRSKGNIHGHIHKDAATKPLEDSRYFNMNWDFHRKPVLFTGNF